jgi:hypothetical protein
MGLILLIFRIKNGMFHFRVTLGYIAIRIDVRISPISPIGTDFFLFFLLKTKHLSSKNPYQSVKSVKSVHPFVS